MGKSALFENMDVKVTIGGDFADFVSSVIIQQQIDGMMTADLSIQLPGKDKLLTDLTQPRLDPSKFIGSEVIITWKEDTVELFKGYVTGGAWNKSEATVEYYLKCQSGPLAMFNTSIGLDGIMAWCAECSVEQVNQIELRMQQGEWDSPRSFLVELAAAMKSFSTTLSDGTFPDGVKKIRPLVERAMDEVTRDLKNMHEISALTTFWGYAGLLGDIFAVAQDMVQKAKQAVGMSWLSFFETYFGQLDVHWVPSRWGTMLLPNMAFMPSPSVNVIFPCMLRSCQINSDTFGAPAVVVMGYDDTVITTDVTYLQDAIVRDKYIIYPEPDTISASALTPLFAINSYRIIQPPPASENFIAALFDKELNKRFRGKTLMNVQNSPDYPTDLLLNSQEKFFEFAQNWLKWNYYILRYGRNTGNVITTFHPPATPGFTSTVVDSATGNIFSGLVQNVVHSITSNSATTAWTLTHVVPDATQLQELAKKIDNPLFVTLKSEIPQAFKEATGVTAESVDGHEVGQFTQFFDDIVAAAEFTKRYQP